MLMRSHLEARADRQLEGKRGRNPDNHLRMTLLGSLEGPQKLSESELWRVLFSRLFPVPLTIAGCQFWILNWFTVPTWEHLDYYRGMKRWADHQIDSWERHCRKLSGETRQQWLGNWTRRSTDEAQFWQPIGRIPIPDEQLKNFHELHLAEVAPGEIYCIIRSDQKLGYNYASRSTDGEHTWSALEATPLYGFDQPGHLLNLKDGRLLCTYGRRAEPFGERACLSEGGGKTWLIDQEIILRDDSNTDMGYPATAELDPEEFFTVYYQIDQPGEKVSINATRWSL